MDLEKAERLADLLIKRDRLNIELARSSNYETERMGYTRAVHAIQEEIGVLCLK